MWNRIIQNLPDLGIFAFCGAFAGILRTIFVPGNRDLKTYFTTFVVCVPMAVIGGGLAAERGLGDFSMIAIATILALVGQGIIEVALDSRQYIIRIIDNMITKYTGK